MITIESVLANAEAIADRLSDWHSDEHDAELVYKDTQKLVATIEAVMNVHVPDDEGMFCTGCPSSWPCDTVEAVNEGLGITAAELKASADESARILARLVVPA